MFLSVEWILFQRCERSIFFLPNKLSPKRYFIKTLFLTLVAFVRYRIFAPSPRIGQLPYKEGGTPIAVSPSFPDET